MMFSLTEERVKEIVKAESSLVLIELNKIFTELNNKIYKLQEEISSWYVGQIEEDDNPILDSGSNIINIENDLNDSRND